MVLKVPAYNAVGAQEMESITNLSGREEQVMRIGGTSPIPAITGSIATATATVTATDVSAAGTLLVMVYGTHAGVTLNFEVLNSSGGNSQWLPVAGARIDSPGVVQSTTGVLASNGAYAWRFPIGRSSQFRVRATSWTSGSLSVIVDPAVPWGEPIVSSVNAPSPNGQIASFSAQNVAMVATAATLFNLAPSRDLGGQGGAAGTQTVPLGKLFRPLYIVSSFAVGTAAIRRVTGRLVAVKSGTAAAGSAPVVEWTMANPIATIGVIGQRDLSGPFPDLLSGWSWGVTLHLDAAAAGTTASVTVVGQEI